METFSTKKESYELKINTLKEQKMALEKKQESEMETKKECEEKVFHRRTVGDFLAKSVSQSI